LPRLRIPRIGITYLRDLRSFAVWEKSEIAFPQALIAEDRKDREGLTRRDVMNGLTAWKKLRPSFLGRGRRNWAMLSLWLTIELPKARMLLLFS